MEKYYSSVLTPSGLMCNYKILCERHPESKFFIISDGTDFEREIFFTRLLNLFEGYSVVTYCPFYGDMPCGIYLNSFNTYILADSVYGRVCPVALNIFERKISLSDKLCVSNDEKGAITSHYGKEKNLYKQAVKNLSLAKTCKKNINSILSDYIIDERMTNALKRVLKKIPLHIKSGKPQVKFLSAVTPLGIHTHWNTVFENFENIIELEDSFRFPSAVIAGVLRDRLISANEEFIFIPDIFHRTVPQMLLLPGSGTAVIRSDPCHPLPFSPTYRINTEKYVSLPKPVKEKYNLLLEAESRYIENAVSLVYDGGDERRKMNKLILPYSRAETAKQKAKEVFDEIIK